ncbi:MAG: Zn-ribbon domain-containing OB-fold protein [Actinobacteria bacterium]|nr:Zn-ribbon domain-containing OB-fold protein [Actinomycetota bacterium]MBU1945169.1 Zn-ribbon domain-containing OB-fold protein [Actinomycetota bacterium]MBU2687707.1 Zn-ribbon domain-containing OB-fold protein [Actinomycetota bacterium]
MAGYLSELEDPAAARFYTELEAHRFMTTRCPACGGAFFPPRTVCPDCLGSGLEWVELPGTGTVYAFSQQHYGMFYLKPEVVAAVELDGCEGRVFTLLDAAFEEVEIGMPVEVGYITNPVGVVVHRFHPAPPSPPEEE